MVYKVIKCVAIEIQDTLNKYVDQGYRLFDIYQFGEEIYVVLEIGI